MKSRRVKILAAAAVLFVSASPVMAVVEFNDGGVWDIDYEINDDVWVDYESPGLETTLNILDGASMPYPYRVKGWEDSIINILGGSMNKLVAWGSSQVTVSDGSMSQLDAWGNSQVDISGGSVYGLNAYESSQVTVSGGSIGIGPFLATHSSQVTVSGGLFGGEVWVFGSAVLTLHGWDFAVDGVPVGYSELYSIFGGGHKSEPYRQLTGTLLNGDPINNGFYICHTAKIVLVPEPATVLLLGLGGLALMRKRKSS